MQSPGSDVSLKSEFYYALFRAGIPANADSVFQASPKMVQAVWEQAIKQGVIPQAAPSTLADALQSFQVLSAAHTLDANPPIGSSTLREMLQTCLPDPGQQRQFVQTYVQYRGDTGGVVEQLAPIPRRRDNETTATARAALLSHTQQRALGSGPE
jgi:hypothetical protein